MAINLSDPREMHEELLAHVGHDIECVQCPAFGNVTIECIDCGMVLVDVDKPED